MVKYCDISPYPKTLNPPYLYEQFPDGSEIWQSVRRPSVLAFKEVSRKSKFEKKVTVDFSDFSVLGGLTPKLIPQISNFIGNFVALAETVATRYYSTPYVKGQNCKGRLPPKSSNPHISKTRRQNFV